MTDDLIEAVAAIRPTDGELSDEVRERIFTTVFGAAGQQTAPNSSILENIVESAPIAVGPSMPSQRHHPVRWAALVSIAAATTVAFVVGSRSTDSSVVPQVTATSPSVTDPTITSPTVTDSSVSVPETLNTTIDDAPQWYRDIAPFLPHPFDQVALTAVFDGSIRYLAIDATTGKGIDIEIDGPPLPRAVTTTTSTDQVSTLDRPYSHAATGATGVHVEITCGIGAGRIGDDVVKNTDYCAMPSAGPVTSQVLQAMVDAIANDFPAGHIAQNIGEPSGASIDIVQLDALVAETLQLPSLQSTSARTGLSSADQFLSYGQTPPATGGTSGYTAHDDATARVVEGVYPPPDTLIGGQMALYDNLAAGWVINPAGTAIRLTTASDPTTVTTANSLLRSLSALPLQPPPTASTPPTTAPTFSPITVGSPPAGSTLAWAHYEPDGSTEGDIGIAEYTSVQGGAHLQLIVRDTPNFFDHMLGLGRQTWQVNNRTVVNDSQIAGCSPGSCSVGVQWDEHTAISVSWEAGPDQSLTADQTLNALIEMISSLTVDPTAWQPGSLRPGTLAFDIQGIDALPSVIVASRNGYLAVSRDDGTDDDTVVIKYIPARIALEAPDGRIVIEQDGAPVPIVATADEPNAPPYNLLWPDNPIPGRVRLHDIAVINGVTTLLYSVNDTIYTAPLDDPTAATLVTSNVPGLTGQARLHLTNEGSILGAISDTATELFTANMNRATHFDIATPETGSRLFAIESSGTHVAWLHGTTITIADETGTTKDFQVPDGIDGTDVVGLDIATTAGPTPNGMITVSYANHNPVVIDIADGSATEIEQSGSGLATIG